MLHGLVVSQVETLDKWYLCRLLCSQRLLELEATQLFSTKLLNIDLDDGLRDL